MRRFVSALVVAVVLVDAVPGLSWADPSSALASGDPATLVTVLGTADASYISFPGGDSADGLPYCGDQYSQTTMTLLVRSQGRQWMGEIASPKDTGKFDDPSDPRFVPCGSKNFPGQYYRGTASSMSPTQGPMQASCGGHAALPGLRLYCSFTLNGTPWLNVVLYFSNYNIQCDGQLLPFEYCDASYLVDAVNVAVS